MYKNILKGKVVSASSQDNDHPASYVCDGNLETAWFSYSSHNFPFYLEFDLGTAYRVKKLNIKPKIVYDGAGVKDFSVQGKNDGSYVTLHSGQHGNNDNLESFLLDNNTLYRYMKINFTNNWDTTYTGYCQVHEIEMMVFISSNFSGGGYLDFLTLQKKGGVR